MKSLLCLPVLCLCLQAHSQETIRVGVELQPYLPYYEVQDDEYRGYARELLDAFAASRGYRFIYEPRPVQRLHRDFLSGRFDLKYPDHPLWNAEQKAGLVIHYSQPTATYLDGMLLKPSDLGQEPGRVKLLGTQNGFTPWPYLEAIRSGRMQLVQNNRIDALLRMALSNRIDAVYLNPRVAAHHLQQLGLTPDALVFAPQMGYVEDHYYLSSIRRPELIAEFDRFLLEGAEQIELMRRRHGL
ncbi:substrate-binding periplasmic protein [Ectopseudomonas guguanensis]|jgi:ABC-type amino acid transport substrate-binding protein|uniref:substrate-binding periplasmic protein n=1 Tax=Ectopseudomonas guguanensis TaxID=1198456 RepID=UPI0039C3F1BF